MVDTGIVEEPRAHRRRAVATWSQEVLQKVAELRAFLPEVDEAHRHRVEELILAAERLAGWRKPWWQSWAQIREWWYGSRIELAWTYLHQAEAEMVQHGSEEFLHTTALELALTLAGVLDPKDPVRLRLEDYVRAMPDPAAAPAHALARAHVEAHAQAHAAAAAAAPGGTTTTTTTTSVSTPRR